ncbi:MAG: cyclase family protein [Hyphomonadaceae bacterium]|nr:cyclase family protein [Hyphomonadaceae bacterium]
MDRRRLLKLTAIGAAAALPACAPQARPAGPGLWSAFDAAFARAKFISLSHILSQDSPLWSGFPRTTRFTRAEARLAPGAPTATLTYESPGLEATAYNLASDQFGAQLDPPAHWHQCYPAIDELPPTLALRKLVVVSIAEKVAADPAYALSTDDLAAWERAHGAIPEGSVVMVRSDWSKRWPDNARFQPADGKFPGVSLAALQFLHLERRILLHGHEPLDTDATPTLVGEDWLLNNGYMQAEGVANLDQVPAAGALIAIGFPRFRGGTGGLASFTAVCPEDWTHGARIGDAPDAPFPINSQRLVWNAERGQRERTAPCDKPAGKLSFN